jgi:hypothetical protein
MEVTNESRNECGCGENCCPPKRKPRWIVFLSALILLSALVFATVKLVRGPEEATISPASAGTSSCCDTTAKEGCDTTKASSCCPQPSK